ncbi:MAG: GGDEF domain-containing protein [Lachnospiraceae bacterium]|nr:GGDEF domain-containing protein [Lachnospiraceae bacterium]
MKKNVLKFKTLKVIELSVLFVLEVVFVIILLTNKTMKTSIFVDKSLFTICSVMYATIILSLAFLVYDFLKLRELKIQAHELENLAYLDSKTGIPNRTSCSLFFENHGSEDSLNGICCTVSEISNIKTINAAYGKDFGDKVIRDFSSILETSAKDYGFVGRNGGNEFITVIEKCSDEKLTAFLKALTSAIDDYNSKESVAIAVRSESVLFDKEEVSNFSELIAKAYKKLGR